MSTPFPRQGSHSGLRGRTSECALLDNLVSAVRRGESRSLVLRGEAGMGKTALLGYLLASTSELTVVRAAGVESEMELAYASLHQLCMPLFGRIERLPAPQRQAIEVVFGVSAGSTPDRFLVGLAVLSLFAAAAEEGPLLCVVDDAQWLDQASALTLAFVARRLLAEPIGVVFAAREPGDALRDVPEVEVHGLRNGDARALLSSAVRFKMDAGVRDRIVAETRGNPLALLELPRGLTATQLAGGFGLLDAQALTGRIEESFVRRLEAFSDDARRLLLVAAAEPVGDPLLLLRASERLGIAVTVVGAETDGLLAIGDRVTFRHPLVRSAVYGSAAVEGRRAAHQALAEATDNVTDPDRRAWHLAAAATGPDEQVALELERSAGRAQARGGLAAAAAFLQRAVALTKDPARRAERALAAAETSLQAGVFDAARRLVTTAEIGPLDEFQHARVDLVRAYIAFASGLGSDGPPLLLKAARKFEPFDLQRATETYLAAWGAAGMSGSRPALLEVCRAALAFPVPPGDPRPMDLVLRGVALLATDGPAAATPILQRAAELLRSMPAEDVLRVGYMAAIASAAVWDYEGMDAIGARQVQFARDAGALRDLSFFLPQLGMARLWLGDFGSVEALVAEEASVAAATGSPFGPYTLMRLRALQGREAETSAAIANAMELAATQGQGNAAGWAHWAAAVLYNGLARYPEALSAARQATADTDPITPNFAMQELVEAAARGGDADLAHEGLERLSEMTQPCGTDIPLGIEARSRALLSDGPAADELYREAIARLSRTRVHPELARAHLVYGEWLRREGRRVDARGQLRSAHEMLVAIGMEAFAERARAELQATGEKVRKRTVETRNDLTPQEWQIARLARDGLSNPEIGARLFLSPRTVEWHLRNVFTKLEIRSRRELATALASSDSQMAPALSLTSGHPGRRTKYRSNASFLVAGRRPATGARTN